MYKQFWSGHGCRQREIKGGDRWEGGHGTVGERIWKWAETNHDEDLETVMFQHQSEGVEAFILSHEIMDVVGEESPTSNERRKGSKDVRRSSDEPAVGKAVEKPGDAEGGGIPNNGWEGGYTNDREEDKPTGWNFSPFVGNGLQPGEYVVVEDKEEYSQDTDHNERNTGEDSLPKRHCFVGREDLPLDHLRPSK